MPGLIERLRQALADRYAIERELGRGGMGTVYLAQDVRHRRPVAIKVLNPELARSLGAERFLREIEVTANLNHPHILPLHDSGEADGLLYYVMPYVEGETLRARLNREGQLTLDDALRITRDVAAALHHAHGHGVVHRDIKPENVLLSAGEAVVADFGIARAVSEAGEGRLTETGISVGTPAYMSPEQASGDQQIDGRTDIYALGCMLYEMLSGGEPYAASSPQAVLARKLTEPAPRISVVRQAMPAAVDAALTKALAREPDERYATAEQFAEALPMPGTAGELGLRWVASRLRRPRVAVSAAVAILALAAFAVWFGQHRAKVRWAREVALPQIQQMIEANDAWRNLVPPYHLAEQAEAILGNDPSLAAMMSQVSLRIDVLTEPPGARVYVKEYGDTDSAWTYLGVTPLKQVRMPIGIFRWKLAKEGYDTVLAAASTWDVKVDSGKVTISPSNLVRTLDTMASALPGMVRVSATQTAAGLLPDFFIGRYEVTNREYKAFVDAGGYRNREYWKHPFVQDGRRLTWNEAMRSFVDASGRPGPSTWMGGDFPAGRADYPVSGVSWYEAAAYAAYAGQSLPTEAHWGAASGMFTPMLQWPQLGGFGVLAPFANFGGQGPVAVGTENGITAYGAHDMAGNVREWCSNEAPQGRVVRGGAWSDNSYEFVSTRQAPAMDRSARNGFRLALYPDRGAVPEAAFAPQRLSAPPDFLSQPPVSDAVFQVYKEQFSYDPTPLNARVEYRETSPGGWIREKVSFDAAYGDERVLAYLFLPGNTPPPFQTVIYFPGSASAWTSSSQDIESYYEFPMFLSFLVRNGRAVLYPVYKGTFERSSPALAALSDGAASHAYTEYLVQVVKDFRRSIDYLQTRPDIDSTRLAYYGMSWGAALGAIIPAVEPRLRASVLVAGGLGGLARPEASLVNYVTRVRTPTLMLNGRYDNLVGLERGIKPMFRLLGTPASDKRLILYDTDHIPPKAEYVKETLAWLDRYLGPVGVPAARQSPDTSASRRN
jgi:formylglycine-generating enzyme required for sulfatase activity/dienelactone hydrolase